MLEYDQKLEELKETKTWITDQERQEVSNKMAEIQKWLKESLEAQNSLPLHEDPVFDTAEVTKRMNGLKKLFTKVSGKKKPRPVKETTDIKKDSEEEPKSEDKKDENSESQESETNNTQSEDL